jgi:hypothetical protein
LGIGSLEIVELYLDSAIAAMRALIELAARINRGADRLDIRLEVPQELDRGMGVRQRLDDSRAVAHWPRMIVTDAAAAPDQFVAESAAAGAGAVGTAPRRRTAIAERVRFVHVGQRARAEAIVQQRQPGLLEALIARQIGNPVYQPEFCRTLFQLMVPHEFKDAARQLARIVLVLDGYTANLPWELMAADQEPLAVRAPMIRQLSSSTFDATCARASSRWPTSSAIRRRKISSRCFRIRGGRRRKAWMRSPAPSARPKSSSRP